SISDHGLPRPRGRGGHVRLPRHRQLSLARILDTDRQLGRAESGPFLQKPWHDGRASHDRRLWRWSVVDRRPCAEVQSMNRPAGLILALALAARSAGAQTAADTAGIRAAAMDYIEGWYAADAARMERAVHPELVKRIVTTNPTGGRSQLESIGAMTMV